MRSVTKRHMRHICTQDDQIKRKIFISRCQFVKCNEFNPIRIIVQKEGISSSLHTIILRGENTNQASHCFDFLCIFFLVGGFDTLKQSQSILTLIVQTIVSAV